ncbi:MAG: hypothetical protein ACR2NG_09800 [Acidimicrobiia bacterium]
MEQKQQGGDLGTRRFRIWVQGRLDEGFTEGLVGLEQEDVPSGTMLSGAMLDQSQLHSTLELLRNLGIDVLRIEAEAPGDADRPSIDANLEDSGGEAPLGSPHESTDRPSP